MILKMYDLHTHTKNYSIRQIAKELNLSVGFH